MIASSTTPTIAMVVYCRLRYAFAPAWMAAAISCMRASPAGFARIQLIQMKPNAIATTAQTSAKMRPVVMARYSL